VTSDTAEQLSGIGVDLFLANAHRIFVTGQSTVREADAGASGSIELHGWA